MAVASNLFICDPRELSAVFPIYVRKVRPHILCQKAHQERKLFARDQKEVNKVLLNSHFLIPTHAKYVLLFYGTFTLIYAKRF
jgi:hypothetical protein